MKPRWFFLALVGVICVLIATTYVPTPRQDVAVLDRLAPQIERSQTLTPQARDKIMQVIDRARAPTGDARNDLRRSVIIDRVTEAIKAKDNGSPEPSGTTGQGPEK